MVMLLKVRGKGCGCSAVVVVAVELAVGLWRMVIKRRRGNLAHIFCLPGQSPLLTLLLPLLLLSPLARNMAKRASQWRAPCPKRLRAGSVERSLRRKKGGGGEVMCVRDRFRSSLSS